MVLVWLNMCLNLHKVQCENMKVRKCDVQHKCRTESVVIQ